MERDVEEIGDLESNVSSETFDEVKEVLFGGIILTRRGHVSPLASPEFAEMNE